jgi:hypothetical protein
MMKTVTPSPYHIHRLREGIVFEVHPLFNPATRHYSTDTHRLEQQLRSEKYGASRILRKTELRVHMVKYKGKQLKFKLRHNGKRPVAASPLRRVLSPNSILLPPSSH